MMHLKIWQLFIALIFSFSASIVFAQDEIVRYFSDIVVQQNGVLKITETIQVNVEGANIKRGIFRDFPVRRMDANGNDISFSFDVTKVELDGSEVMWSINTGWDSHRLKIGDPNKLVEPGTHTYNIHYTTDNQLRFFEGRDELFWNVTGNGWAFPILEAGASVSLPEGYKATQWTAYTGPAGSANSDYKADVGPSGEIMFLTTTSLDHREGLTIVLTWPEGGIERTISAVQPDTGAMTRPESKTYVPTPPDPMDKILPVIVGIIGTLILFVYFYTTWLRVGKDPERKTIIAHYEPPTGISPAACRFIKNMTYDYTAFTAAILNMAVGGFIKIEKEEEYSLIKTGAEHKDLSPGEKRIAAKLFKGDETTAVLGRENSTDVQRAITALGKGLKAEFENKNFQLNRSYLLKGLGIAMAAIITLAMTSLSPWFGVIFMPLWGFFVGLAGFLVIKVLSGESKSIIRKGFAFLPLIILTMVGVFGLALELGMTAIIFTLIITGICLLFEQLLQAPTVNGRRLMDEIEGFKLYLSVAEKDRLNFHNPPDMTPEHFEEYLPYAVALGVGHEWGQHFDETIILATGSESDSTPYRPHWYGGSFAGGYHFNASEFAVMMDSTMTLGVSQSTGSSSSSSGFSSGGGFSGGGGGGGGGGGW